jgi:uncharacterized protein (TIGR03086 family)
MGDAAAALVERFHRSVLGFGSVVARIEPGDWDRATPCAGWDVRQLVAHLTDEHRWIPPLLEGRTIDEVGPGLDSDVLGADPHSAWARATAASTQALAAVDRLDRTVHLSFGDTDLGEYLMQLLTDHLIHTWDLAQAVGGDQHLDPELVGLVEPWFTAAEGDYRAAGLIGDRPPLPERPSARTRLLAMAGRTDDPTAAAVTRFDEAFGAHDLEALEAAMTDDCVFESTSPPDGIRHTGRAAVRTALEEIFASSRHATFTVEELVVAGPRAFMRWRSRWDGSHPGHVRFVDLYAVRDGQVGEVLAFVKG